MAKAVVGRVRVSRGVIARGVILSCVVGGAMLPVAQAATAYVPAQSSDLPLSLANGDSVSIASGKVLTVTGSSVALTVTGSNVSISNAGTLQQTGTGRGIRVNSSSDVTGLVITNTGTITTADADVIQITAKSGTPTLSVTLNNYGTLTSFNASAGGAQVVDFNGITTGSNIVHNYAGASILAYEADAVRPGVNGVVYNAGTIRAITTTGSSSDGIDLQTNSGGVITNDTTGLIEGGRHGITGGASSASVSFVASITNAAGGVIRGDDGSGLNFDGYNANQVVTVVNHGSIYGNGVTGDGDGIDVDGLVDVTNTGLIQSLNAYAAVSDGVAYSEGMSVGGGSITNSGTIRGSVAEGNTNAVGRGISLVGNDILDASGNETGVREGLYGNAVVVNQAGGLIQGDSAAAIWVGGNANAYTVSLRNDAGARIVGGGTTEAAIQVGAYNTTLVNAGVIDGSSSGKAIQLGAATNQVTIQGGAAQVLGDIDGGAGSNSTLTLTPGAGNTFSYNGAIRNFNRVEVQSGTVTLSGASSYTGNTVVSGGTLVLDGLQRLSAQSSLVLSGGDVALINVAGQADALTLASLSVLADASFSLGGSAITFDALGLVTSGVSLSLTEAGSGVYAIRFLGDATSQANFLALVQGLRINGEAVRYSFDGAYTNVAAVPEPGTWALVLMGALVVVGSRRRGAGLTFFNTRGRP